MLTGPTGKADCTGMANLPSALLPPNSQFGGGCAPEGVPRSQLHQGGDFLIFRLSALHDDIDALGVDGLLLKQDFRQFVQVIDLALEDNDRFLVALLDDSIDFP